MTADLPTFAVATEGLEKTYASARGVPKHALKKVDLSVPRGSFFALLGPNGAGKSTLINILAGLVTKTAGAARIWGYDTDQDMRNARLAIGVVPQELNMDPYFSPRELLEVQAGLYGVPKAERRSMEILEQVGLADKADAYSRSLSGGMKRRLLVAKAMVHSPPVLVLDEPTAGVDVELRRQLWTAMKALNDQGTTILLTTHYLEEAEELCDTVAIINHGELVTCEPTPDLLARLDCKEMTVSVTSLPDVLPSAVRAFQPERLSENSLLFRFAPSKIAGGEILRCLGDAGMVITDVVTREADLEDVFVQLTSGAGPDAQTRPTSINRDAAE